MIAVPMSPPSMISPSSMKATGTSGTSMCFHCVSSRLSCLRASRSAPQRTSASLPNSLGWSWKGPPTEIQFWLPLTATPIPGTWTRIIRKTEPSSIGYASARCSLDGIREATSSSRPPSTAARNCLRKKYDPGSDSCSAVICEAEYTITSPSTVISRLPPRIR